jgi:hypothetical protein
MVLRFGLASSEWVLEWCERARAELAETKLRGGRGDQAPKRRRSDAG